MTAVRCHIHGPQIGLIAHKSIERLILEGSKGHQQKDFVMIIYAEEELGYLASYHLRSVLSALQMIGPSDNCDELILPYEKIDSDPYFDGNTVVCPRCFDMLQA